MTKRINERKTLTEYNSCDFKCELNGIKCNSNQKWSKDLRLNAIYVWKKRLCLKS